MRDHSRYKRPLGTRTRTIAVADWSVPTLDTQRLNAWSDYVSRIHSAIKRARFRDGFDGGTLGDHLYETGTPQMRRSA